MSASSMLSPDFWPLFNVYKEKRREEGRGGKLRGKPLARPADRQALNVLHA